MVFRIIVRVWITAAVRHKAIDCLRRKNMLVRKQVLLQVLLEQEERRGEKKREQERENLMLHP
jgi:predicted RNA polymerase sigma factor